MSEVVSRKCDECETLHGAVNNWWCVVGSSMAPMFATFEQTEHMLRDGRLTRDVFRLDYCSHKCVGTAFHRWLDTGDVRPQPSKTISEEEMETV